VLLLVLLLKAANAEKPLLENKRAAVRPKNRIKIRSQENIKYVR
jgi:hypothetical protein